MAKIAVRFEDHRPPDRDISASHPPQQRVLASGEGWTVSDVVCTSGPYDRPYEEQHTDTCVAIVVSGTFQYRTSAGGELMTPGSLLLGNAGDSFTCGHEHGKGDRCISFSYSEEFRERIAPAGGITLSRFRTPRISPLRALSPLVAKASALIARTDHSAFEELGIRALAQAMQLGADRDSTARGVEPSSLARVTRVIRAVDNDPEVPHDLLSLARIARLSPYHFLRMFELVTGITPYQYLLRVRLRRAAICLRNESTRISDIAMSCGFGDVSNFNRTFRAEFGMAPRAYRFRS